MRAGKWEVLGLLLSMTLITAAPAVADEWEKTYRLTGRPDIVLRADDASITFETWDRAAVGVRIETRGLVIGPRGVKISERVSGNHVELQARDPRLRLSIGFSQHWTRIHVSVPRNADLDVSTGDGAVAIEAIAGAIHVNTADGAIAVAGAKGAIHLHTGDGSIRATDLDGTLDASSGDGSIHVSGRFLALDLETGDGSIAAEARTGPGPREPWSVSSGDGAVVLRLPADFRADLDAHTGDGHISLDFPVEVSGTFRHTAVRGAMNGGGPGLRLSTGDGSIRIGKL